jgi:NodT family efflux transporter outer membrane factor (OMF) lipoprotein
MSMSPLIPRPLVSSLKDPALNRLALALCVGLLAACAPIPQLPPPAATLAPASLGLAEAARSSAQALQPDWWQAFGDAQLNGLIEQALAQSPNLALARARVARAAAVVDNAEANDQPTIGLQADATRQRFTEHGIYPAPLGGSVRNIATVQLGLSYDWDFFGRHEAQLRAALGQHRAAQADAAAARLGLAHAVSRSYVALARVQAQARLLAQQIQLSEQSRELVVQRARAGLDNQQAQRQAEAPLPDLRRQQLMLEDQQSLLRHQLAALCGQGPEAQAGLQARLPMLLDWQQSPALDLLGRRPDLVAARERVEASMQDVRAARAQFYPSVNLSAFAGVNAIGFDQLFKTGSRQMGAGPALRLPLFETGHLRAQLKGSAAEQDAAVASYNQVLLEAVREAADQLGSLQSLRQQAQAQAQLAGNIDSQYALVRQRTEAGLGNRLGLLQAQQSQLQQQRLQLDLQAQTLETQINLMRALGGGYQDSLAAGAGQPG